MNLSKDCIDIGARTDNLDDMLDFWTREIGLPYDELLKIGGGVHQHRLKLNGSIFKLNHSRAELPDTAPTGYRELLIASDVASPKSLVDPDGNLVTLVPQGEAGITHIGMRMAVSSLANTGHFFEETLGAQALQPAAYRWGTTVFLLEEDPTVTPTGGMQGRGYRYTTVQVFKVDAEHAGLLERGAIEAEAPRTLGETARISFITDPDGNWIEISQRKSLTGNLSADE
jgi:lactoylglutathione lyase